MSFSAIDLSSLPAPDIIEELDIDTIFQQQLEDLRNYDSELADNIKVGDPAYNQLLVSSTRELVLRQRINEAAKSVMLPYSTGADLDNLGSLFNDERLTLVESDETTVPPTTAILENDDNFRARIQLAMEGVTNAGTEASYILQALKADSNVKDVAAESNEAGNVLITLLSRTDDGNASNELINTVSEYINQKHIRQLTDNIAVQSATIINYSITATLYFEAELGSDIAKAAALKAVTEYVETKHSIGTIVPISGIYRQLQQEGVVRVELTSPTTDITPFSTEAAYCSNITITGAVE